MGGVLILTGPPGAGKTTTARLLAERADRAAHVEADWFFEAIRSGFVEPWKPESHEQNATVMRIAGDAAAGYAAAGYLTIVEGMLIPGWFYEPLRDRLRDAGHEVTTAILRPPLEVCLARRGSVERAVVEQLWNAFADLGDLERCVVDAADLLSRPWPGPGAAWRPCPSP